jgi:hypothetical protein
MAESIIMKLGMHVTASEDISTAYFIKLLWGGGGSFKDWDCHVKHVSQMWEKSERNEDGYKTNTKESGCSGR